MPKTSLEQYNKKRDFTRTPEPRGIRAQDKHQAPLFVVQQHHARSEHYDFRIEYNGVLKSWAIPKGPSLNPQEKRLALMTEDHPLSYAHFEGIIPEGNYGAGPVIVWDLGIYYNLRAPEDIDTCIAQGELILWLEGKKLQGGFALIRTKLYIKNSWLCIKMRDKYACDTCAITKERPESVKSGKTIDELYTEQS
jgi:bifunctional non-homologous end joining protein LigD